MIKGLLKKKKIIFVTGEVKEEAGSFIRFVLKDSFKVFLINGTPTYFDFFSILKSDVIIIKDNEKESVEKVRSFLGDFSCYFVVTEMKKKGRVKKIIRGFLEDLIFVLDFSIAKKLKINKEVLTFGINKKSADFYITDIHQKENEINFKVNYGGNSIPFWIKEKTKKKEIYGILPALCIVKLLKINIAEVSHKIKEEFFTEK
jgi:hypothetical protein